MTEPLWGVSERSRPVGPDGEDQGSERSLKRNVQSSKNEAGLFLQGEDKIASLSFE